MCVQCDNHGHCEECVEGYEPVSENEEGESDSPTCISEEYLRSEQECRT